VVTSPSPTRPRLVVVGGGIAGLAAAWSAHEEGAEVLLLEASPEVGGKARTRRADGWTFEEGPTGFLSGEPVLHRLIERAGLVALEADPAAARRYVVRGGRAREIPTSPPRFLLSGILSPTGLLRFLREPWVRARRDGDESVWDFAERRLGVQVAERLIAPMVLGVFAGDARRLSLPAAFPRMRELEAEHGSLIRAMLRLSKERKAGRAGGPAGPAGKLHSFAEGMQALPIALAERAPFEVRTAAPVTAIARAGDHWRLSVADAAESVVADAVVLAAESDTSARLVAPLLPEVARELEAIPSPGLAVVGLRYDSPRSIGALPVGFGALIPRGEELRTLGCLFDTQLFAGRAPAGRALVRCMIGGATDPEASGLAPDELARIAADDMARLFGLPDPPVDHQVTRWQRAIPQYELGHLDRVGRIEGALDAFRARTPGLYLAGNFAHGVAFGKVARQGWEVGAAAALARRQAAGAGEPPAAESRPPSGVPGAGPEQAASN